MININELKSEHPECFDNSDKFKAYLKDLYPSEKARANILAIMFSEGIKEVIESSDIFSVNNFCRRIYEEYGFDKKLIIECYNYFAAAFIGRHLMPEEMSARNRTEKSRDKTNANELIALDFDYPTLQNYDKKKFKIEGTILIKYRGKEKSVKIPYGVTGIFDEAFYGCSTITDITVPNSVNSICRCAFAACDSLMQVSIPNSVTSIGADIFKNCDLLIIYCEDTCQPKGWNEAWNSSNRPTVWNCQKNDKDENRYSYVIRDGIRYSLKDGEATVIKQPGLKGTVIIPLSVSYKNTIYKITGVSNRAFQSSCITSIRLPNSITCIGDRAFCDCGKLISIEMSNGIKSIGDEAFRGCSSLRSIVIPNSISNISGRALFSFCSNLKSIAVASGNRKYYSSGNCIIETENKKLIAGCNSSVIPADGCVTSIGDWAFFGCNLESMAIPNGVISIGWQSFACCQSLISVTIPHTVINIGGRAFENCSSLTCLKFNGYETQWYRVLKNDNWQEGVNVGCKVQFLYGEHLLPSINYPTLHNYNRQDFDINGTVLKKYKGEAKTVKIPYGITDIGEEAFAQCRGLTDIEIPDSVNCIEMCAFSSCSSLESVKMSAKIMCIECKAFQDCKKLTSLKYSGTKEQWKKIHKENGWHKGINSDCKIFLLGGMCIRL